MVRRAFLDRGIEPVRVADYVGALLGHHLQSRGSTPRQGGGRYLVDLVQAIAEARSPEDAFVLQAEVGDVALYLSGVFPDWIWHRRVYGRRLVDIEYYEAMGSRFYGVAARSGAAERLELGDVLAYMSENFPELRRALNDMVDEHLHLAPRPADVETLLRRAMGRATN